MNRLEEIIEENFVGIDEPEDIANHVETLSSELEVILTRFEEFNTTT